MRTGSPSPGPDLPQRLRRYQPAGLDFYRRLAEACLESGITHTRRSTTGTCRSPWRMPAGGSTGTPPSASVTMPRQPSRRSATSSPTGSRSTSRGAQAFSGTPRACTRPARLVGAEAHARRPSPAPGTWAGHPGDARGPGRDARASPSTCPRCGPRVMRRRSRGGTADGRPGEPPLP